ncbi:hypothetical protein [Streptomyces olivaceus]|uniref:hypothetical protein n=1 Tax=Streptomyces olivaceus TaxID=47716 RepID=UPI004056F363
MKPQNELRLLPWTGPGGKPCYLSTDDRDGYMSRLADNIESVQLGSATDLVERATELIDNQDADPNDIRHTLTELTAALQDVLRVATSRGHLLAVNDLQR